MLAWALGITVEGRREVRNGVWAMGGPPFIQVAGLTDSTYWSQNGDGGTFMWSHLPKNLFCLGPECFPM